MATFGELAADEEDGGWTPRGSEPPFLRNPVSEVVVAAVVVTAVTGEGSVPPLFMLLIMSRTELLRPTEGPPEVRCWDDSGFESPPVLELFSPTTEVSSPDFRSTPTIDHGLGFGRGFGFGGQIKLSLFDDVVVVIDVEVRGFGSGEVPVERPGENFEDRSPTIDPFKSSFPDSPNFVEGVGGVVSEVGEVRFATRPVDLIFFRHELEERERNKRTKETALDEFVSKTQTNTDKQTLKMTHKKLVKALIRFVPRKHLRFK